MKRILCSVLVIGMTVTAACKRSATETIARIPNPPFEGDTPKDAYLFKGESGLYGGAIVLSIPDEPKTFNVMRVTDAATADVICFNVFRSLVDYRNGGEPPDFDLGLCTKWDESPDGSAWTFNLRRGLLWSDGEPFDADDVVFSYNVILDQSVDTPARDSFIEGRNANDEPIFPALAKLDDYTVRFSLHRPNGSFLDSIYNLWLIPSHKWERPWRAGRFAESMGLVENPSDIVGLGPFRLKEYVSGQRVVLERNPHFWKIDSQGQRLPYLDRIVYVIVRDMNTIQTKFSTGEIDVMAHVRPQDYALVKRMESEDIKVEEIGISHDTNWLVFNQNTGVNPNTRKPFVPPWKRRLFRDIRFRQAVSYAIDREALVNTIFSGRAVPIYSFVTPGDKIWFSDDIVKYKYNPTRAQELLADIGLKHNSDGWFEDGEHHTVEIELITNASNAQRVETASFIAKSLQNIGLKANVASLAMGVLVDKIHSTYDFDAIVLGWQMNPPPGPSSKKNFVLSSGLVHICFPSQQQPSTDWEARVDSLILQAVSASKQSERFQHFAEVQKIWSEELPEINLVATFEAVAYKNHFGNLHPALLPPRVTWNSEEIYVKN